MAPRTSKEPPVISRDPMARLKNIQVLVVDNDAKLVEMMISVLKKLGFGSVLKARDGFEAVKILREEKIDLLISDWELRPMEGDGSDTQGNPAVPSNTSHAPIDGACFVRFLRSSKYSPDPYVTIIMLTGLALRDNIEYARDSGVNEILVKPVSAETLCSRISMVIRREVPFITSANYRGPCRRRIQIDWKTQVDRRKYDLKVIKYARG